MSSFPEDTSFFFDFSVLRKKNPYVFDIRHVYLKGPYYIG